MAIDWKILKGLIDAVPVDIDRNLPRHQVTRGARKYLEDRDCGICAKNRV